MNIKSQAIKLQSFLSQFENLWNEEIMNRYPETIKNYPEEWIECLDQLDAEELYAVDCKVIPERIKGSSFAQFMQTLMDLSHLPESMETPLERLEDWAFNGVRAKKRHEIERIVPVLKKLKDDELITSVVDIGGGVGHLSRVLAHYHGIASISLDQNADFQKIGKERLKKYRKLDIGRDVEFVHMTFKEQDNEQEKMLRPVFTKNSLTLGLHTCGPLANSLIRSTLHYKNAGLFSFGCCYYRLDPKKDFPLSRFYKEEAFLPLNSCCLCLATRSHAEMDWETYLTKERVKNFRYALHLFLMKNFNMDHLIDVGECNVKVYWGPFASYIRRKLNELGLQHDYSDLDFETFFNAPEIKREIRVMYLCNIIRWQLGRALEVYLLLDRALYLEEQGMKVEVKQYFKEALSPRNIGILALFNH